MEILRHADAQRSVKAKCISFILLCVLKICDSWHPNYIPSNVERLLPQNPSTSSICLTPGCVKAAAEVLWSLDETIDPCDDFYRFACGGWLDRHPIPDGKSYVSVFSEVQEDLNMKLKVLLEKELTDSEPEFIKMIKSMYDTCLDLESLEESGAEPLKAVLRSLGGWPTVEGNKWNGSNFDWIDILHDFRKLGYSTNTLLNFNVVVDSRNNTVHILGLDQPTLGMPDRTYLVRGLNDSLTAAYFNLMVKSAKLLGADESSVENELLKALHFEIALANFSLPREERLNISKLYNKYTVARLQEEVPQIPWLKYFNGLLNEEIDDKETLIVLVPDFMSKFANLITSTDKRVVANYMLWRVVDQCMSMLSKEWRDLYQKYNSVISGINKEEPRWGMCLNSVNGKFGIALSSYYVRHYFKGESKDTALELVKYIHREFSNILDEIDWMDDETKKQAKAKCDTIKTHIGYPKELLNNTAVLEIYENLTVTNENYFENVMRYNKWLADYQFSHLRKPNIKGDWKTYAEAAVVNAMYYRMDNSIEFPAGILQNPAFNKDRPQYMNFGAIGIIIGHEITHGFDSNGRQYDKDGNNVNWWNPTTDELFKKKAQCIIDQYSNYTAENGMKLNGILTLGENIADVGGLKEAYWAYHSWVKDHGEEQRLPGLKYTQSQLFWISAANIGCTKLRTEILKLYIISASHSLAQYRVNGPVSNLPEFAKEFNCSPDSAMNKKDKCQVW